MKTAKIAKPPHLQGIPRVDFFEDDFQALVYNKGLKVIIEPAFPCPCKMRVQEAQTTCLNCQGVGWCFGSATEVRAVITSINKSTKYKEWSTELIGTSNITVEQRFQLSFMDKITIVDSFSIFSENLLVVKTKDKPFLKTAYPVLDVQFLFKFTNVKEQLKKLNRGVDFEIEDNRIVFLTEEIQRGDSITVRYTHNIQYFVIDLNHDVRNTYTLDYESKEVMNKLPVSAIIRRVHCVIDSLNIEKTNLLYNETR